MNIMDAGWIEQVVIATAKAQGITPRYIKPGAIAALSDELGE